MRVLCDADEALFSGLYTDPETMRFIGPPLGPACARRCFLALTEREGQSRGRHFFSMLDKATRRRIGICGLQPPDPYMAHAEAGVLVVPDARAKGYAREGLSALVETVFESSSLVRVWVQCSALNPLVERMVSSIGFTLDDANAVGVGVLLQRVWSVYRSSRA